jgi:hypothetical protein
MAFSKDLIGGIDTKMNKVPDYDSGCFSIPPNTISQKTHNLNSKELIAKVLYGGQDSDCKHDSASLGYPEYDIANDSNRWTLRAISDNIIGLKNMHATLTLYYRILIWRIEYD